MPLGTTCLLQRAEVSSLTPSFPGCPLPYRISTTFDFLFEFPFFLHISVQMHFGEPSLAPGSVSCPQSLCATSITVLRGPVLKLMSVQVFQLSRVGPLPCLPFSIKHSWHRADATGSPLRSTAALPPHTHTHTAHNCVRGWYLCTYCFPLGCAPLQLFLIQSYLSEPLPPASPKKPSEAANPRAFLLSLATSEKLRSPAAFLVPTPGRAASLQGTWQRALPPFPCSFLSTAGSSPHSLALHPPRCLCTSLYPSPGSSLSFPIRETRKFGAGRSSIPLAPVPGLLTWSGRELGLLSQQPLYRAGSVCAWGRVATQALGRVRRVWRV